MNIQELLALLPHRYPFLLLDRIVEVEPGRRVVALKNVSVNEPQFQGHFPGAPVMPGVLVIEAVAQAACVVAVTARPDFRDKLVYLAGVDGFRFRRPVTPGDQLLITVEKTQEKRTLWRFAGRVEVGGVLVAEGELLATVVDRPGA